LKLGGWPEEVAVNLVIGKEKVKLSQELILTKIKSVSKNNLRLGIDVGSRSVKLVLSEEDSDKIKILYYEIISVSEKTGFPQHQITQSLKKIIRKHPKSTKNAYFNVSGEDTFVGKIILPAIEDKEMPSAIRWQIRKQVSFPTETATLKYKVISKEELREESDKEIEVLAAAVSEDLVGSITNIINKTGIYVKGIFVSPSSLGQIIKKLEEADKENIGVLDIGYKNSTISIYDEKGLKFIRTVPVSSYSFTEAMTGVFTYKDEKIELNFEKAEKVKQSAGIPEADNEEKEDGIPLSQIKVMLRPQIETLFTELTRTLNYFETKFPKAKLGKLYVCGGGAKLKNLIELLNKNLPIEVEELATPKTITLKARKKSDYLQMAAALGASLGVNQLNLLPDKFKRERLKRVCTASLRVVVVILFISLLWSSINLNFRIEDYSKKLAHFDRFTDKIKEAESMHQYTLDVKKVKDSLARNDLPIYLLLKGLSYVTPEAMAFETLEVDNIEKKLILKGVIISPEAKIESDLIDFSSKLKALPFFNTVNLKKVYSLEPGTNKAGFEITCSLEIL
jgi:type IV pilus assembly protein PilM